MSKWIKATIVAGVAMVGMLAAGCAQQSAAPSAAVEDKTYAVTPASATMKAGIITGEMTEMKVTEQVEKGSDHVVSPARLTGTLRLKNASSDQTVRAITGKVEYIDAAGQPIKLEASRTDPGLTFAVNGSDRLDPGQDATQPLDLDFPAEALKSKKLKEIRFDLAYLPSAYEEATVNLPVSIGAGK